MKKKRLPLAMLTALTDKADIVHPAISETPEVLIYPYDLVNYQNLKDALDHLFDRVEGLPDERVIIARSGLPYRPDKSEWTEIFTMLCNHCAKLPGCEIIDGMIETKDGGPWPEGGWVTDAGAGVSCLSYEPRAMRTLPQPELEQAMSEAVPMCSGCAAQKGSEASVSLHTRRDFKAAVNAKALFTCHADGQQGKPCGGWCSAVKQGGK